MASVPSPSVGRGGLGQAVCGVDWDVALLWWRGWPACLPGAVGYAVQEWRHQHQNAPIQSAEASTSTISPEKSYADVLDSIDKKLTSLDAHLALVEVLHREFQPLRESLEFSQEQLASLTGENQALRDSMKTLTDGMTQLSGENKKMMETILDIQARGMGTTLSSPASQNGQRRAQNTQSRNFSKKAETPK
ncbi:hypothetical protein ILYODFUR_024055 [Ilyodon furcidens]|uniref:Uncharacterized protein n=1 Tax=Ilyodon furcidens TaxID=33524 RepID=A0ABV0V7U2_9TELE